MAKRPGIRLQLHDPATNEVKGTGDAWSHVEYVETDELNADGTTKLLSQKLSELEKYDKGDTPTTVAVGGIPAGTNLNNMSIDQILYDLTHPYVSPKAKLTMSGTKVLEKGTSITLPTMSVEVTAGSVDVATTTFYMDGTAINTDSTAVEAMTSDTLAHSDDTVSITDETYFYAEVNDGTNTVESNTVTFSFVDPAYIGTVASGTTVDAAAITGLTKKVMSKATISNSFTVEEGCMVIATPAGWEIGQIVDPNGFDITDSFTISTVDVTTAANEVVAYNVYVSEPTSQTNFTVKFVAE